MRLKDGRQVCPRCSGAGCYWCRRTGHRDQCPACMNQEPELITKNGNELTCTACSCKFDVSGNLLQYSY